MQQAQAAIVFVVLRRLGGAVLFRSSCPSPNSGYPFWLLALTFRSSRPACGGRLTSPVSDCDMNAEIPLTRMIRNKIVKNSLGTRIHVRLFKVGATYKITQGNLVILETANQSEANISFENACLSVPKTARKISAKVPKTKTPVRFFSGGIPS